VEAVEEEVLEEAAVEVDLVVAIEVVDEEVVEADSAVDEEVVEVDLVVDVEEARHEVEVVAGVEVGEAEAVEDSRVAKLSLSNPIVTKECLLLEAKKMLWLP
jgi:hypothetical protein